MNHHQMKSLFLRYSEGKLADEERLSVEGHLAGCSDCRQYYEWLSDVLSPKGRFELPQLEPDPFLPTRVAALVGERRRKDARHPLLAATRVSFAAALLMGAVTLGIYLGDGLAPSQQYPQGSDEVFSSYYEAIAQEGFATSWTSVIEPTERNDQ
jgi:anti-sigma factor RsiW